MDHQEERESEHRVCVWFVCMCANVYEHSHMYTCRYEHICVETRT